MTALYLASGSPRRRELLTLLELPFERLSTDVAEERQPGEAPQDYVLRYLTVKCWKSHVTKRKPLLCLRHCPENSIR
jgi:predicted house-cleaning NTP pyrophosphatase (Maf/HAM1 superfamily)